MEIVTGAMSSLLPKLDDLLVSEYMLQKGIKGEIRFLQTELESMQGALMEISMAPAHLLQNHDKIWAKDARELSYDIEDSIDTFMVRGKGGEPTGPNMFKKFMDRCFHLLTQFQIRRNIATEIRDIKRRVIEVSERRDRYKIDIVSTKPLAATVDPRLLAQYTTATELVGIEEPRDELILQLLTERNRLSKPQDKIVSIVGFGGLGKTTLATAVYENIRGQFDCCAFVSVSQTPDRKKLFNGMLYDLGKNINIEAFDESWLINKLRESLQEKRYLVVIDDIWDITVWKYIRSALPDNNYGYRIITTTRNSDIAQHIGGIYKMNPLSPRNSRILLFSRVFSSEEKDNNEDKEKCPNDELAEVSDKILKKCAGVPLAIITIASLLARKGINKMDWYDVYHSVGTGLENNLDVENMRKILSFSYYDMPSHLRTCLLYLSVFPEDYEIDKNRLIWMWIGEGFIQHAKQGNSLFKHGESYFYELINRSMIQPVYDNHGLLEHCRLHDMVLDFICCLSSEENFINIINDMDHTSPSKTVRRLSLQNCKVDHATTQTTRSMQQVRSVVAFPSAINLIPALGSFRVIRVLDLEGCDLSQGFSLNSLGNLFHLRYLSLRDTGVAQLPEEIRNLQFLQTLDVRDCNIIVLPPVTQLRHLMCLRIDSTTKVPNGTGSLTSLEELSTLGIQDHTEFVEVLDHLTELRVLRISLFTEWNNSLAGCLVKLQKIQSLYIEDEHSQPNISVMDSWVAPRCLRRLEKRTGFWWFSKLTSWMNPSHLPDLSVLSIRIKEIQQDDLEILGRLPALSDLDLEVDHENLGIQGRFIVGAHSFPCLVHCKLWGFVGSLEFQQGALPRLKTLHFPLSVRVTREIAGSSGGFNLGLGNLPSLQDVTVEFQSGDASVDDVVEAKAALNHAVEIHPNRPTINICGDIF